MRQRGSNGKRDVVARNDAVSKGVGNDNLLVWFNVCMMTFTEHCLECTRVLFALHFPCCFSLSEVSGLLLCVMDGLVGQSGDVGGERLGQAHCDSNGFFLVGCSEGTFPVRKLASLATNTKHILQEKQYFQQEYHICCNNEMFNYGDC